MSILRLLFVLLVASCACRQSPPPVQPLPPAVDAGSLCSIACARLAIAGCSTGGDACVPACERDQAQGAAAQLDPMCVVDAMSMADLAACGACP